MHMKSFNTSFSPKSSEGLDSYILAKGEDEVPRRSRDKHVSEGIWRIENC